MPNFLIGFSVAGALLLSGCLDQSQPLTARPPSQRPPLGLRPETPDALRPPAAPKPQPSDSETGQTAGDQDTTALPLRALMPPLTNLHFSRDPLGTVPADWVDVSTEHSVPPWVYRGSWGVEPDETGNAVLMHRDIRQQPAVSFLRYRGSAWHTTNGEVPLRYRAEMTMRSLESPHNYPPTGDQGVQFFYRSPSDYLEVIIKPWAIEVWEARGGVPQNGAGWYKLWERPLQTGAGDKRRIGAIVDREQLTMTALLDGEELATVRSESLREGPAWLALRGIGNVVSFDDIELAPLTTNSP